MKIEARPQPIARCEVCEDDVYDEEPHSVTDTGYRCADCPEDE